MWLKFILSMGGPSRSRQCLQAQSTLHNEVTSAVTLLHEMMQSMHRISVQLLHSLITLIVRGKRRPDYHGVIGMRTLLCIALLWTNSYTQIYGCSVYCIVKVIIHVANSASSLKRGPTVIAYIVGTIKAPSSAHALLSLAYFL